MSDDFIARFGEAANGSLYSAKDVAMTTPAERDATTPQLHDTDIQDWERLWGIAQTRARERAANCYPEGPKREKMAARETHVEYMKIAGIHPWGPHGAPKSEREEGRQAGLREAAEIARGHNVVPDEFDDWRRGYCTGRKDAAESIEARAKEKQP
jgi:hypothetical protein